MDGYVILESLSASQLVLDAWLCDPGAIEQIEDYWTYTEAAIELLTTIFKITLSDVTGANPVLPKVFPSGSTFYSPPTTFQATEEDFYLYHWEMGLVTLPVDAIPGVETYNIHVRWYYRDTPADPEQGYLLPYNQEDFDAGDGETYKYSDANAVGYSPNIWRWQQWATLNRYICYSYAIYFHELGGDPDWGAYVVETNPTWGFHLQDETTPPAVSDYLGGNVWNISDEFSDAIEIDSGTLGDMNYYYLNLGGCSLTNSKTALQGEQPPPPNPTGVLGIVVGLWLIVQAFASFPGHLDGQGQWFSRPLRPDNKKGLGHSGKGLGHSGKGLGLRW